MVQSSYGRRAGVVDVAVGGTGVETHSKQKKKKLRKKQDRQGCD